MPSAMCWRATPTALAGGAHDTGTALPRRANGAGQGILFGRRGGRRRRPAGQREPVQGAGRRASKGRPYFEQTPATKRLVISAPLNGSTVGMPIVVVTQPVFDARGGVRYVLAASA